MKKRFPLGAVLSVTTEILLTPITGLFELLNFMTADNLFTHQRERVRLECRPFLLQQHPKLATVDASGVTPDNWPAWLADQVAQFGAELEVETLPEGEHYYIDPLSELAEKVHPSRILVIKGGDPK
jgi:hypothetical protein